MSRAYPVAMAFQASSLKYSNYLAVQVVLFLHSFLYIANMLDRFLKYLQAEKRYSPHTLRAYHDDIVQLYTHLEIEVGTEPDIKLFKHQNIRAWVASLMQDGVTARTVNRKLSSLSSFFKFLVRKGVLSANPMVKVVVPKQAKRLSSFLESDKLNAYLDNKELADEGGYEQLRNFTIVELFYSTGIRLSELVNLRLVSVDFSASLLKVEGKGSKERLVPLTPYIIEYLHRYIGRRMAVFANTSTSNHLFLTAKGKQIYPRLAYGIVTQQLSIGGFAGKRSPHILRHSFATHMLNNGANLNSIKEILGHSGLGATQVYTHNTFEKLKNVHRNAHPRS